MNWIQIREELVAAILARDIEQIGRLADWLRFEAKLNYNQQFVIAHYLTGVAPGDWDDMLFEADMLEITA